MQKENTIMPPCLGGMVTEEDVVSGQLYICVNEYCYLSMRMRRRKTCMLDSKGK